MLQQDQPDDYVIATGETHSVRELCEIAFSHVGLDYDGLRRAGRAVLPPGRGRPAGRRRHQGPHGAGWEPKTSFAELVPMMVDADLELLSRARDHDVGRGRRGGPAAGRPRPGRPTRASSWPSSTPATTSCCTASRSAPTSTRSPTRSPAPSTPNGAGAWPARRGRRWRRSRRYGGEAWFNLGDRDLGTHLYRTARRHEGATADRGHGRDRRRLGPRAAAAAGDRRPAADLGHVVERGRDRRSRSTSCGRQHSVPVSAVRFDGRRQARPAPGVLDAIADGRAGRDRARPTRSCRSARCWPCPACARPRWPDGDDVVAVSPIVAGAALKGPADRLLVELGHESSVVGVARLYAELGGHARDRRRRRRPRRRGRGRGHDAAWWPRRSCPARTRPPPSASVVARVARPRP